MVSPLRQIALVAFGFVLGLLVTLLLRQDRVLPSSRQLPPDSPKAKSTAQSPEGPPTAPEPQKQPADEGTGSSKKADDSKGMMAEGRATTPLDPDQVMFGRRDKPEHGELLTAPSWDRFYDLCKAKNLWGDEYEDLVFRRTVRELDLDAEKADALKRLLKAEQAEVTRMIYDGAGGAAGFDKVREDLGTNRIAIHAEWRRQRDVVRLMKDAEYLKIVTRDQLTFFNEHLRNTEIGLESTFAPEGVYHLICGVGKPPK